jgi:hypothetical protein
MAGVRADLVAHCGGSPSTTQRMLIERAVMLTLQLHLMDRKALRDETVSERNSRQYLAWSASLCRLLRQLGIKGVAEKAPTLKDHLAARAAQASAAAA